MGEGVRKINRTNTILIITTSGVLFVAILFVYQTVQLILHFRNFKGCCVGYFLNSTNNLCESKSFQLILIYKVREVIIINIIVFLISKKCCFRDPALCGHTCMIRSELYDKTKLLNAPEVKIVLFPSSVFTHWCILLFSLKYFFINNT